MIEHNLRLVRAVSKARCRKHVVAIAIVGDVRHSRVARSSTKAFAALGAKVTLVGPPTMLPESLDGWPASVSCDLDAVLPDVDVVYLLRIQHERQDATLFPSLREYTTRFGLTVERAARLRDDVLVMHAGPMNRGVEIAPEVRHPRLGLTARPSPARRRCREPEDSCIIGPGSKGRPTRSARTSHRERQ